MTAGRPHAAVSIDALRHFLETPIDRLFGVGASGGAEEAAVALFRSVAQTTPAYRAFLADHGVEPERITGYGEFQSLPVLTKANYVLRYPLTDRCPHGRMDGCEMVATSSGTTGEPCVWPRGLPDELLTAARFEQVFRDSFKADVRSTLAVVCFALGTWVGGTYTATCCRYLAAKGYPITVATPGNNQAEILRVIRALGPLYEQVVLLGYPPFLKSVIDSGRDAGMEWACYGIRLVMAGEVFSEKWRDLVLARVGSSDPFCDAAALYGTADAGVLAVETPLSIGIRRFLSAHPDRAQSLFGAPRLPTLAQYDPRARFFEVQDGRLLFTGAGAVPLVRYDILDDGGVISYADMMRKLHAWNAPIADGNRGNHRRLPFVYVFGRSDFTVSFFGANVYPENIAGGLEHEDVCDRVSGKFISEVTEDTDQNAVLSITVELAAGVSAGPALCAAVTRCVRDALVRQNSEYANYVPDGRQAPRVSLAPAGDPTLFPPGMKHRYTRGDP